MDANHRARRSMLAHHLHIGLVHALEILHIFEKDIDMNDMVQVRTDGRQHDLKRGQNLFGLRVDIRPRQLTRRRVDARRATNGDELAHLGNMVIGTDGGRGVRRGGRFDLGWHHSSFLCPWQMLYAYGSVEYNHHLLIVK